MSRRNEISDRFSQSANSLSPRVCIEGRRQAIKIWIATFGDVFPIGWIMAVTDSPDQSHARPTEK
ncbi:MAG: hypothetical protein CME33_25650 [Gimesia sp.]|nr:hypothetical protein [Gimesia sp.]